LLDAGEQVVGVDNLNNYYDPNLKTSRLSQLKNHAGFQFQRLELADRAAVQELFREHRFDRVVHLAAQAGVRYSIDHPEAYIDSNLVATANILEGCRHAKTPHLVYASSSSVYGAHSHQPFSVHRSVDHPVSLYAATKKANELMAHTYSHLYRLPTTGLRFFTVYGPWGRPDMALYKFTDAIIRDQPIDVYNRGQMRRDFTYIDDITIAMQRVMDKIAEPNADWDSHHPDPGTSSAPYRIYNIGNHRPTDLNTFIGAIEQALGKKAIRNELPMQPGDVLETFAEVRDLQEAVGFSPSTTIEKGIQQFVAWYRDYHSVPAG
jgi:UDP-glucuronate 4-epimerase